jgi:nondiscriminating glutamyl-tRNA synthetase
VIRTRFAPSPTGSLHVGNARVAILNWLFTRRHGGTVVLRIEDTDATRTVPGSESAICRDLLWLGLDWDEGPACGGQRERGEHGPYRQSQRSEIHRAWAGRLRERGLAYPCYCTAAELEQRRAAAIAAGRPARYDRRCLTLGDAALSAFEAAGRRPAWRVRVAAEAIEVHDAVRGTIRFPTDEIGDFVIMRSDGEPTYNFAVVVDDITMRITHVIRGAGHLSNTPRQVLLHELFDTPAPVFAHVPTVLGPDRQKLSKRHGAQALADYRSAGYHPEAIVNYLSLLAWSSASGEEVLSRERLIDEASLDRIGTADVIFDPTKLRWLSGKHIERLPLDDLVGAVRPFVEAAGYRITNALLPVVVQAVRSHLQTYADVAEQLPAFYPSADTTAAVTAALRAESARRVIENAAGILADTAWEESALTAALKAIGTAAAERGPTLYQPLRLTLTGREHGPPLVAVLLVQGRDRVLHALRAALELVRQ